MTNKQVLDWLKTIFPDVETWGISSINKNKNKVIGVYSRRNGQLQPYAMGGSSYGIKAITLLIHWGDSATPCEEQSLRMYNKLQQCTNEIIGNNRSWIVSRQLPVQLGTDDTGKFEATLDFDIYYRKAE